MSRSQKVILTNMCLIEDNKGRVVMQIRDPKRLGQELLYQAAILKKEKACMMLSFEKFTRRQV